MSDVIWNRLGNEIFKILLFFNWFQILYCFLLKFRQKPKVKLFIFHSVPKKLSQFKYFSSLTLWVSSFLRKCASSLSVNLNHFNRLLFQIYYFTSSNIHTRFKRIFLYWIHNQRAGSWDTKKHKLTEAFIVALKSNQFTLNCVPKLIKM